MSTITFTGPQFQSAAPTLKLTKRGKIAVIFVAFIAMALLALVFVPSVAASGESGAQQETRTVTVMAGETLWQIAADANPHGDIRDTVDEIVQLNSLPNASAVTAGVQIAVPVY